MKNDCLQLMEYPTRNVLVLEMKTGMSSAILIMAIAFAGKHPSVVMPMVTDQRLLHLMEIVQEWFSKIVSV